MYQELEIDLNTGDNYSYPVDESGNRVGVTNVYQSKQHIEHMTQIMNEMEGQSNADSAPPAVSQEMENKVLTPDSGAGDTQTAGYTLVGPDTELEEDEIMRRHNERLKRDQAPDFPFAEGSEELEKMKQDQFRQLEIRTIYNLLHDYAQKKKTAKIKEVLSDKKELVDLRNESANERIGEMLLAVSIVKKNNDMVKYCIEEGVDVNKVSTDSSRPAIHWAVGTDNKEAVEMLIEAGADLNKLESETTRYTIMHTAAFRCKDKDIFNILIEKKCSLNDLCVNEHPPMTYAALMRRVDIIELLIDAGADTNVCLSAEEGGTDTPPLFYVSEIGSLEAVKCMVEKGGADVKWKNKFGDTPGMWVANTKENPDALEILKYYADKGMDMNVVNTGGYTMMHKAASRGTIDTVRYLVEEHKVDLLSATQDGNLPLHYAANCHSLDIVSYLVEQGGEAQLSAENTDGHTALWMAENGVARKGEDAVEEVVEYLESKIGSDKSDNDNEKKEGSDEEVELEIEERA